MLGPMHHACKAQALSSSSAEGLGAWAQMMRHPHIMALIRWRVQAYEMLQGPLVKLSAPGADVSPPTMVLMHGILSSGLGVQWTLPQSHTCPFLLLNRLRPRFPSFSRFPVPAWLPFFVCPAGVVSQLA